MIFKILLGVLAALVPAVALAEPITLSALIATFGPVAGTAAFVAINMAIAFVAGKILAPDIDARDKDRKQTVQSGIEPRRIVYGEAYNSGPMVYLNTTGDSNKYLHMIVALATHPSDKITELLVNDETFFLEDVSSTDLNDYKVYLSDDEAAEKRRRFNNKVICVPVTGRWMYGAGNDEGDINRKAVVADSINFDSGTPGAPGAGFESLDSDRFKIEASVSVTDPNTQQVTTFYDEVEILKVYSDVNTLKGVLTNQRHYYVSGYYYTGIPAGGTFKVWFAEEDVTSLADFYTVDGGGLDAGNVRTISGVTLTINPGGDYTVTGLPSQDTVVFPLRARYNGQQVDVTYTIIKSFAYNEIETGDHFNSITLTSTDHAFRYNSIGSGRYTLIGPPEVNFDIGAYLVNAENVDLKFYAWEIVSTGPDVYDWVEKPNILTNISNNYAMEEGNVVDGHGVQTTATLTQPMPWNETEYRLDRCTYVYVRLQHDTEAFSGNIPNIAVKMRGKRLYNPLQDLSVIVNYIGTGLPLRDRGVYSNASNYVPGDLVDSTSFVCIRNNIDIPTSNKDYWLPTYSDFITDANQYRWEYSNNWALATLDYLLDPFYGLKLDTSAIYNELDWDAALRAILDSYDGGYLDRPNNTIPASRFTNDEAIAFLFPKLTVDGVLDTSTTPIQNLETLFTGAGGEMAYSQGKHSIYAGVYREAQGDPAIDYSIVVDESYLAGDGMSIDTALPSSDSFNIIQGVYIDNRNKGEATEFAPLYSEEYITADGEEYITDVDYPMTTSAEKAKLLAVQALEGSRLSEVVNLTCNFKIFKYKVGDVVFLKNDIFGYNEDVFPSQLNAVDSYKQFKIISMDIKENFEVDVSLQEISYKPYNPNFVWNIPPERELPNYTSTGNPTRGVLRPNTFNIGDIYIQDSAAGVPQHNIDLSWNGPVGTNVTDIDYREIDGYQIRYAPVGVDIFTQIPGQTMQETTTVPVQLSANFVAGVLDSVTILNPLTHYGYWADGQITVNTSFTGTNPNNRAIINYTVAGDGTINLVEISYQGTSYTNGTGVRLASVDVPKPTVANPGFSADDVHDWKDIEVVANNTRVQHSLVGLLLEQGVQDYAIGIRSRAGDSFSGWTYGFVLGGPAIQYNIEQVQIFGEQVFKFLAGETVPTYTSIELTAVLSGSLTTYSWEYWNGVDTWLPLSGTNNTSIYTLDYNNPAWGTDTTLFIRCVSENGRSDSVNITKLYDGQSGTPFIEVVIPNNNHSIPMSADGTQLNYTGSGTLISAYFGTSQLQYVTGTGFPLSDNQFTVEFAPTDVISGSTSGSIPVSGLNAAVADLTNISAQLGRITYTIRALVGGEQYTVTKIQNFTRVADGTDGYAYVNLVVYQKTDTPIAPAGAPLADAYEYTIGDGITPINGWVLDESAVGTGKYLWKAIFTRVTNAPQTTINTGDWVYVLSSIEASNGFNTATLVAYKRSADAPTDNPGTTTYTFSNASWGIFNGWSKTIPEGSNPVWLVAATALSQEDTDTINSGEWSSPVKVFQDGDPGAPGTSGLNVATVYIYQRTDTDTPPGPPTENALYTFSGTFDSGAWDPTAWAVGVWSEGSWNEDVVTSVTSITGLTNGWTSTIPAFTGSNNYLWVATATASSNTESDIILSSEWSDVQKLAQNGSEGVDGRVVNLTTDNQSFVYNTSGEIPTPATSTITATALNTSGTVYYEFLLNGIQVQAPGVSNTYVYTPTAQYTAMPEVIEVRIREDNGVNPVLATDQMTLFGIQAGSDATSIQLTNEAHVLYTTSVGAVDYVGSGTDIRVYIGSTPVPYGTVGNLRFEVSAAVTSGTITISTPTTESSYIRRYGVHSGMTTANAVITFTITVVDEDGTSTVYTRTQSLSKSIAGSSGSSALNIGSRMDRLDQWWIYGTTISLEDSTADWTIGNVNGPAGTLGLIYVETDSDSSLSFESELITFDPTKKHRVSFWAKQPSGTRVSIPFVEFYNSVGNKIGSTTSNAQNWPGIGTNTHNIFSPGIIFPADWTLYSIEFGGDATATVPTATGFEAVTLKLGMSLAYGPGTVTTLHLQDFRIVELANDGIDGVSPVVGLLSNESHTVAAANNGTGYLLTGAGGTFRVWEGTTDVTGIVGGPVYSVDGSATKNGLTISIDPGTGVYSLNGASWTSTEETFTLHAVYNGVTIERIYTIVKSLAGTDGSPAKLLTLISSAYGFKYDGDDVLLQPASIVFTATQQGSTATVNWVTQRWNGFSWINTPINRMSPTIGLTSTLTEADFDTQNDPMLRVVAWFVDGVSYGDAISIAKIQDGTTPADPIVGLLSNESHTVAAASNGTGYSLTTAGGIFRVWEGIVDITGIVGGPVYSVDGSATKNGLTISIDPGTGVYSLNGASWTSTGETFTLHAVYNGVTIERIYTITKSLAGGDGTPAKLLTINSSAYAFKYDSTGVLVQPSSIVFEAIQQGSTSPTISWASQRWTGTAWITTTPNRMSPTTGSTSTLTEADFAAEDEPMLRVVAWFVDGETYEDSISIAKVQDGLDGTPGGSALNIGRRMNRLDQWFEFSSGLPLSPLDWTVETVNGPTGALGLQLVENGIGYYSFKSEPITFDRTKRHRVSFWAKQPVGDRLNIPFVQFYDATGAILNNPGGTGWNGGSGTHNIMLGTAYPTTWTLYTFEFGGDATALVPANAVTLILGGSWAGGGTTATTLQLQDYQIVELAQSGTSGTNITMVYRKEAAPGPATPTGLTNPPLAPVTWYATIAAAIAAGNAADPLWSSVGSNVPPSTNWSWQQPVRMEGVLTPLQLADFATGIDPVVTFPNDPDPLTTQVTSGGELVNYYFSVATGKLFSWSGAAYVTGPGNPLTGEIDLASEVTGTLPVNNADLALRNASISLSASGILTGAGSSSPLDLGQLDGEVTAGQIAANQIFAEKLAVLAKHLVNPVSMTGNIRGWGGILEDGTGTSTPLAYDGTENALALTASTNYGTRSNFFEIDNNKIYRIAFKIKRDPSLATFYTGLAGWSTRLTGSTVSGGTVGSSVSFTRYDTSRANPTATVDPYFHPGTSASINYVDNVVYLIGMNRSVNDCPAHVGTATYPYIKVNDTTTKYVGFRFLNWSGAGNSSTVYVKDISITEIGTGQIVAENIAANAITANKIAANAITASKIAVVSPNLVRDVDTFDQYLGKTTNGSFSNSTNLVVSDYSYSGGYSLRHVSTGASSYKYITADSGSTSWIRLTNGKRYIFSAYVLSPLATASVHLACVLTQYGTTTAISTPHVVITQSVTVAEGWTRITGITDVISGTNPAATFYIRHVSSGITTYWDAFQLEEYNGVDTAPSFFRKGGATVIDGGNLVAESIHGDTITANTLDAGRISGGTISSGISITNTLQVATNGQIFTPGKNSIGDSSNGFFLGYDGVGSYDFEIGNATKYLRWDGSASQLTVGGDIIVTGNLVADSVTDLDQLERTTSLSMTQDIGQYWFFNQGLIYGRVIQLTLDFTSPASATTTYEFDAYIAYQGTGGGSVAGQKKYITGRAAATAQQVLWNIVIPPGSYDTDAAGWSVYLTVTATNTVTIPAGVLLTMIGLQR